LQCNILLQCGIYLLLGDEKLAPATRGTMVNQMVKENMRSKLMIASIFTALVAGTGIAAAQIVDDPPGSAFQDQGIREWNGQRATPSVFSRTAARARALAAQANAAAAAASRHKAVRHHHSN
jgi:hypothetical protein